MERHFSPRLLLYRYVGAPPSPEHQAGAMTMAAFMDERAAVEWLEGLE